MKQLLRRSCFAIALAGIFSMPAPAAAIRVILDTDIAGDADDVGAVAMLHTLADRGEAQILGMGISANDAYAVACLDVLNTFYGRADIPIGVMPGIGGTSPSKYARALADEFPHKLRTTADAEPTAQLYRRLLAKAGDREVLVISIGPLTNIAALVASPGDEISPLTGKELVEKKVRAWVAMGGKYPVGVEYNFQVDAAATRTAITQWPTPAVFSGFEIGSSIYTGAGLAKLPAANPVRRAYELFSGLESRQSWDQTAVLYAVRELAGEPDSLWSTSRVGIINIAADGSNHWREAPNGKQRYLIAKAPPAEIASMIEALMAQPPKR